MIGRWVVRGLAVSLVAACVAAWAGSYRRTLDVGYCGRGHVWAYFSGGRMNFAHCATSSGTGWYCDLGSSRFDWKIFDGFPHIGVAGIRFVYKGDTQWMVFPLWFPALVAGGLTGWVWYKTRAARYGRGFPVEVEGGGE